MTGIRNMRFFVATYETDLPSAVACLDDDFEACIAHLKFPLAHRRAGLRSGGQAGAGARGRGQHHRLHLSRHAGGRSAPGEKLDHAASTVEWTAPATVSA
jgi:hypothetical protein